MPLPIAATFASFFMRMSTISPRVHLYDSISPYSRIKQNLSATEKTKHDYQNKEPYRQAELESWKKAV